MGHYKALIGQRLRFRDDAARRTEAIVSVAVLNRTLDAAGAAMEQPLCGNAFGGDFVFNHRIGAPCPHARQHARSFAAW